MADGTGRPAGGAHLRWDEMAVGHVLGGLDDVDRALFREHLTTCADCRSRVSELRAMASSIEAAASTSEHPPAAVSLQDVDEAAVPRRARVWRERRSAVVTLAAIAISLAAIMWLLAAVGRDSQLVSTARVREATLEALGRGTPAVATFAEGVRGVVVASNSDIAWTLTGLPDLADDERIAVWFTRVADGVDTPAITMTLLPFSRQQVSEGRLAGSVVDASSAELLVTIETVPLPSQPTGIELVRAQLPRDR